MEPRSFKTMVSGRDVPFNHPIVTQYQIASNSQGHLVSKQPRTKSATVGFKGSKKVNVFWATPHSLMRVPRVPGPGSTSLWANNSKMFINFLQTCAIKCIRTITVSICRFFFCGTVRASRKISVPLGGKGPFLSFTKPQIAARGLKADVWNSKWCEEDHVPYNVQHPRTLGVQPTEFRLW